MRARKAGDALAVPLHRHAREMVAVGVCDQHVRDLLGVDTEARQSRRQAGRAGEVGPRRRAGTLRRRVVESGVDEDRGMVNLDVGDVDPKPDLTLGRCLRQGATPLCFRYLELRGPKQRALGDDRDRGLANVARLDKRWERWHRCLLLEGWLWTHPLII